MTDLLHDLINKRPNQCTYEDLFDMIEDILIYFNDEDEEEYTTNQHMVGMKYLFRGFIVKTWKGVNLSTNMYKILNKIVVYHCVMYYKKCWDHRNKAYHNEAIQRERVIKWYRNIKEQIETKEPMQVRLFIIRNRIQIEHCKTERITQWIYNAMKMIRKCKELPQNDIRRYFESAEV